MPEPRPTFGSMPPPVQQPAGIHDPDRRWEAGHALLFTGHMIDSPDRAVARFPAWAEGRVRQAIRSAVENLAGATTGTTIALAGAASGGDLLFHECCRELGIPTQVLLALPPEQFEAASVAPAGTEWVRRFRELLRSAGSAVHVMNNTEDAGQEARTSIWERANVWMLERARFMAPEQALLALWDGQEGDGPGGTKHFIEAAQRLGVRILPAIKMQELLQRHEPC